MIKQFHSAARICLCLRCTQCFFQCLIICGGAGRASGKLRHECGAALGTCISIFNIRMRALCER